MLVLCLSKTKVDIAFPVYFWVFYSVLLAYLSAFMQYQTGFIIIALYYRLRSAVCNQAPTSGECGEHHRTRTLALAGPVSTELLSLQQSDIRGKYGARTSATGYPGLLETKTWALVVSMTNRCMFWTYKVPHVTTGPVIDVTVVPAVT